MIYLITGSDQTKAWRAFERYLEIFKSKQPEASVFQFSLEDFKPETFEEVATGQTLFVSKHIVAARRISSSPAAAELITRLAKEMADSVSAFLFYEPEENEVVKTLIKHAKETKKFELKTSADKNIFNIFAVADALGARDRQALWLTYHRALLAGASASEVFWKLTWQVKNMLLVNQTEDITKTGLKPFVANKTLRASRNYSLAELKNLQEQLTRLYHQTFPESDEFNFGLEKILLTI